MRSLWSGILVSTALAALLGAPEAKAQSIAPAQTGPGPEAAQTDRPDDLGANDLGDVVIQARRVDEMAKNTPLAVTVLTGERLRDDTVTQIQDLQHNAPSLEIGADSIGGAADPVFTLRGLSSTILVDPAVVAYFDDVPADPRNFAYSMYDLRSVQVLKGPQGTLFGKNSTGGAVLFEPNKPGPYFGGYVDARLGNYNDAELQGAINAPVNAQLWLRAAGDIERREGVLKSVTGGPSYDNRDHQSARLEATWRPLANFQNYLELTAYQVRENNNQPRLTGLNQNCPPLPSLPGELQTQPYCAFEPPLNSLLGASDLSQFFARQQSLGRDKTVANQALPFNVDYEALTDVASGTVGPLTLKDIIHTDEARYVIGFDYDGTPAPVLDETSNAHNHFFSNEFQIIGALFDKRLNWIAGAYYSELDLHESDLAHQLDFPIPPPFPPTNPVLVAQRESETSWAGFAQASYDLSDFVKGLGVTAGYRYTWDQRAFTQSRFNGGACAIAAFPGTEVATCTQRLSNAFSHANYNLSLNWQATPNLLVYAATREGYKAGGFNFTASQAQFVTYRPETVKDVEIGAKSNWRIFSAPLRANIALFRTRYDNIQSGETVFDPLTQNLEQVIVNQDPVTGLANKATLWGGEVEIAAKPLRYLTVSAFASYTHAVYDQFLFNGLNLANQNLDSIPRTYGLTATYAFDAPEHYGRPALTATLYHRAQGTQNASDNTAPPGAFTTLDLRLDWRSVLGKRVDLALYGDNVTNARYIDLGLNLLNQAGIASQQYNEPASFGLEMRYHFGAE